MQVGAIGSMQFSPYIYNTNSVNRASMNKISAIGDDLLANKTDFSALSSEENVNPLKRGETLDFTGILSMQMQMGRMNAARVMKEPDKAEEVTQAAGLASDSAVQGSTQAGQMAEAVNAYEASADSAASVMSIASGDSGSGTAAGTFDYAKAMEAYQPIDLLA